MSSVSKRIFKLPSKLDNSNTDQSPGRSQTESPFINQDNTDSYPNSMSLSTSSASAKVSSSASKHPSNHHTNSIKSSVKRLFSPSSNSNKNSNANPNGIVQPANSSNGSTTPILSSKKHINLQQPQQQYRQPPAATIVVHPNVQHLSMSADYTNSNQPAMIDENKNSSSSFQSMNSKLTDTSSQNISEMLSMSTSSTASTLSSSIATSTSSASNKVSTNAKKSNNDQKIMTASFKASANANITNSRNGKLYISRFYVRFIELIE
jgi:hypothetical protein